MNIKVIGVGDAGGLFASLVHLDEKAKDIHTIALNTVIISTDDLKVDDSYLFESSGAGTGGNPMVGRQIAEKNKDFLFDLLADTQFLILTAGMGGGTGTGATHVIAYVARELRIPTVAVVSTSFSFEGSQRQKIARLGIKALQKFADEVVVFEADSLKDMLDDTRKPMFKNLSPPISEYMLTLQFYVRHHIWLALDKYHDSSQIN